MASGEEKKAGKKIDMKNVPENLVFGLDIGTRSIVGTVGYKTKTNDFIVVAQVSLEHETRAMLDGQIHDIGQVAESIKKIHKQLEEMTGRKLHDVCIAAAGRVLKTVESEADMHFNSETVVDGDHIYALDMLGVEKAYETLRNEIQSDDVKFYCVGYSVKQYYQNDYPISNLEGHKCTDIRTEMIATFLPDEVVDGLYAAVERAGLYVANLTLEPIAAINVAIPERFRLLNIALVDVGAGTSDISITRDGSIIAYGMIPSAGDEVTECIARHYLTDFTEADRMKRMSTDQDEVEYHDIMGLTKTIASEDIISVVKDTVQSITKSISEKISELNGGKAVSAIFVVGGGGKIGGFVESLAEYQEIPAERVALRGKEVLGNITFKQKDIQVDSLLVTPIGICLNFYEQRNNFIFVNVNGERIKLYDNSKLTIMDAAMQMGFPNEQLFPQRGATITYYVDGEKRMLRGKPGEAAVVHINGKETGINTTIDSNDKIDIKPSTKGQDAELTVGQLPEFKGTLQFEFNGRKITSSRFVVVNGERVSEFYKIQDGDKIEVLDYYTLQQVLEMMDIAYYSNVTVNNLPADKDTKIYDNFTVLCDVEEQIPIDYIGGVTEAELDRGSEEEKKSEEEAAEIAVFSSKKAEKEEEEEREKEKAPDAEIKAGEEITSEEGKEAAEVSGEGTKSEADKGTAAASGEEIKSETETEEQKAAEDANEPGKAKKRDDEPIEVPVIKEGKPRKTGPNDIIITVNGEAVVLKDKANYIFVDILDFYPVDTAVPHGDRLEMKVNGKECDFMEPVKEGDEIIVQWVNNK